MACRSFPCAAVMALVCKSNDAGPVSECLRRHGCPSAEPDETAYVPAPGNNPLKLDELCLMSECTAAEDKPWSPWLGAEANADTAAAGRGRLPHRTPGFSISFFSFIFLPENVELPLRQVHARRILISNCRQAERAQTAVCAALKTAVQQACCRAVCKKAQD